MSIVMKQVSFAYGNTIVCRDLNWRLPDAGIACLWGPSGCGKTTLLRLLAGLERPSAGEINGLNDRRVSMVFQEDRLLPWMTALENVMLPGTDEATAAAMLGQLGLAGELDSLPANLSGGQQRRVALARALAASGELLLLDEPFNGLDEDTWQGILPLIRQRARQHPVVLVTHIRRQAELLGATILPLSDTPLSGDL